MTDSRIPVTLLTGFLGSGKTTVLNHLVHQPALVDALVIINEFGQMPLDHQLVAHSTENLVMEMSSGCLCCNIRSDLVNTLRNITWRFSRNGQKQFRRVLIETTGLADPAPVIHTLLTHPQIAPKYQLDGIVATLDLATGMQTLNQHPEAVKQIAVADVLLLTKFDLVSEEQRATLLPRLEAINPAAERWDVSQGEIAPEKVLNLGVFNAESKTADVLRWLKEEAYVELQAHHDHDHHHHDVNRHDDHIRAFCFSIDEPISEEALNDWLELLKGFVGSNILRIKGIFNVAGQDQPVVMHGVQHVLHPPVPLPAWPDEDRRSRVVFITQDVNRDMIENTLRTLQKGLLKDDESSSFCNNLSSSAGSLK